MADKPIASYRDLMGLLRRASARSSQRFWDLALLSPGEEPIEYAHAILMGHTPIAATVYVTDARIIYVTATGHRWHQPLDEILTIAVSPAAPPPAFRLISFDPSDPDTASFTDLAPGGQAASSRFLLAQMRDALAITAGFMTSDGKPIPERHITPSDYIKQHTED